MGKLALFLVLAAALGGSVVTLSTRGTVGASAALQSGVEADVVVREIAETARSLAVSKLLGPEGFDPALLPGDPVALEGGEYVAQVVGPATPTEATIRVVATYGGAVHTTRSTYRYDPMDVPGPIWIDAPVSNSDVVAGARPRITDGDGGRQVVLDPRLHAQHQLESFYPTSTLMRKLAQIQAASGVRADTLAAHRWEGDGGVLGNLNVRDTQDLYNKALQSFDASKGDVTFAGRTVRGQETWRGSGADRITLVNGDLRVAPGARVEGSGVLVVNGGLYVEAVGPSKGSLTWDGLVIAHSNKDTLPVELKGRVTIRGALAVAHTAFPPGGHLDVSVYGDISGMDPSNPGGVGRGRRWPWKAEHPWFDHAHAFDQMPVSSSIAEPRGPYVVFLENGAAGPHEDDTAFRFFKSLVPSATPVYVEFGNAANDGYATYRMTVAGQPRVIEGAPSKGFPDFFQHPVGASRSAVFPLGSLRSLDVNVRSLRALRKSFDDERCDSYPVCIGNDWNRKGALALRIVRAADDKRLYESTFYWHMREDEVEAHEAAEEAWRRRIRAKTGYGAHLTLGNDVDVAFRHGPLDALVSKMGFDPDAVRLVTASADHLGANEPRVACVGAQAVPLAGALSARDLTESLGLEGTLGPCQRD